MLHDLRRRRNCSVRILGGCVFAGALIASSLATTSAGDAAQRDAYAEATATCTAPSEFVKTGTLGGHDAVAIVLCSGGSGLGSSVRIFVNFGAQNGGTADLGEISGGDHVNAYFAGGSLYVTSALHGAMLDASGTATGDESACNQCYTRMLVQRIGTRGRVASIGPPLIDGGIAVIALSQTEDYRRQIRQATFSPTATFEAEVVKWSDTSWL